MTVTVLKDKRIVLGVTGSIACYKSADLASKLTQAGALVDVILTDSAQKFVTPLTFRSVTGRPVYSDMWSKEDHVQHVNLGENADLLIVSPATAHTIGKLANGLADNLLTVTALAARCPILIAPAMDGGMFAHPAVSANIDTLVQRGATMAGPGEGRMASGLIGKGRLLETPELIGFTRQLLGRDGLLAGQKVVISAGPTQEPLDPVRYLTNRSSGKQGMALVQAALDMGAEVTVVTGPIHLPTPVRATRIPVRTAEQMKAAVLTASANADILVMAAAVSDFRPKTTSDQKIKKNPEDGSAPALELTRNPDILQAIAQQRDRNQFPKTVIGFAAETQNIVANGMSKLKRKNLDFIAINDVSSKQAGFAVDTNQIVLLGKRGLVEEIPLQSKSLVAERIFQIASATK